MILIRTLVRRALWKPPNCKRLFEFDGSTLIVAMLARSPKGACTSCSKPCIPQVKNGANKARSNFIGLIGAPSCTPPTRKTSRGPYSPQISPTVPNKGLRVAGVSSTDPWIDPTSRSSLGFHNLPHRSIRAPNWGIYFWDPPRGLRRQGDPTHLHDYLEPVRFTYRPKSVVVVVARS